MNSTNKVIACLYASIVAAVALAEPVTFKGNKTIQGYEYIKFDVSTYDGKTNIKKVSIDEDMLRKALKQGENFKEVTLVIPWAAQNKQIHIGSGAFRELSSDPLKLSIQFEKIGEKDSGDSVRVQLDDCWRLFYNSRSITKVNLGGVSLPKSKSADDMFGLCLNLKSVTFGRFNTWNISSMSGMFANCISLEILDFGDFSITDVTNMSKMFYNCSSLKELDLSKLKTSKVKDMEKMFQGCENLTKLNVKNFNTSNVTNMEGMFKNCSSLEELNLGNFDTAKVADMGYMFEDCVGLKELDLKNFNTDNVETMEGNVLWL